MLCSSCTFYSEYNEQPKVNIPLNPSATIGKLRDNSLIAYVGGLALGRAWHLARPKSQRCLLAAYWAGKMPALPVHPCLFAHSASLLVLSYCMVLLISN